MKNTSNYVIKHDSYEIFPQSVKKAQPFVSQAEGWVSQCIDPLTPTYTYMH